MIPLRDHNRSGIFPIVTVGLILINVLVFLYELTLMASGQIDAFLDQFAFIPAQLLSNPAGEWYTVITAMFLHGGWLHLLGNMLYLWIFGDNMEATLGKPLFILFYLAAGIVATFAQALVNPNSVVPNLGASGAIAGVLGGYLVFFPNARVDTAVPMFYFIRIVPLSAIIVLGFWFLLEIIRGVFSLGAISEMSGGVAYFAHIGGFVAGLAMAFLYRSFSGQRIQTY
ncbi:MAG: rhomboid family intramembrane serine protease [Aggregatilineales bacterium]|nr:rhomboid family intramembrane serine protease [Aggregatilineales bacterium]HPV06518.1 rhomboid family intramembrane serine protease [Aggregatilineales bacterium]HQE19178.1 rhomboid family intramembrane serine protease [Aggregatilineales bacterium]